MAIENLGLQPNVHVLTGDTPEAFAGAVSRLLRDEGLRNRIGQAGREYVIAHYALERVTQRLIACYEAVRAEFHAQ